MTMIERVARAICRADNPCWSIVSEIMDGKQDYAPGHDGDAANMTHAGWYRQRARAAIAEMREPTEGMRLATLTTDLPYAGDPPFYEKIYLAMIDAALNEEH